MTAVTKPAPTLAEQADIHELYELSVQDVKEEAQFVHRVFKEVRGRTAYTFREDFCGTASLCCEWVRKGPKYSAVGIDIEPSVLEWGRKNRLAKLRDADKPRVQLIQSDVLTATAPKVDMIGAFNFSYWIFRTRDQLRAYFSKAREGLVDDGILLVDAFGGSDAIDETKEKTKLDGFTYVWHQARYEPVTGFMRCHIHFKFPDGSRLKKAFTYEWRFWTLPEIQELLLEAGFSRVRVYWEESDEDGEGNGEYSEHPTGDADPAWIAYILAEK